MDALYSEDAVKGSLRLTFLHTGILFYRFIRMSEDQNNE